MINILPPEFKSSINTLLKNDADKFWQALAEKPLFTGLRINPQKFNSSLLLNDLSVKHSPIPWEEYGFLIEDAEKLGKHPYHGAGIYYLQEASAMVPVSILDPQPGERILDLCAAPGGKTTQIHGRMNHQGIIIANDPNPRRVKSLALNTERWGARNITVLAETPQRLVDHFGAYFDRVLVDAPCSGEGTFRTHPGEIKKWSSKFSQRCAVIQDEILWYAGKLVRPGGVLVYSTCTFNQLENEGTIKRYLDKEPGFDLDPIPSLKGYSPGLPTSDPPSYDFSRSVRIWPHLSDGEGHFIARLIRRETGIDPTFDGNSVIGSLSPDQRNRYKDFFDQNLERTAGTQDLLPDSTLLAGFGNRLYRIQSTSPSLSGLNVQHWGWWLGTFKADRFIPSSALASGIKGEDAQKVLEFSLGDPNLAAYLRGSPIMIPEADYESGSWVLVTISGVSLGWGKTQQGRLKSHYPNWLKTI